MKKEVKDKDEVLDVGTGSGILAAEAAKVARRVDAVDIDHDAIIECKRLYPSINFRTSDLFMDVDGSYDLIIFNPPYLPLDEREPEDSRLATTGGKKGYEVIERFLHDMNAYLDEDGRCLLLFSSLSKKDVIDSLVRDELLGSTLLSSKKMAFEELYVYRLEKSPVLKALNAYGLKDLKRFSRGHRGLIFTAKKDKMRIAIKVQRPDSEARTINREADVLRDLNKHRIGPKILFSGDDFFAYKFVEGEFIVEALKKRDKKGVISVLHDVFDQMRTLDVLHYNKEEMHHPLKHVIVGRKTVLLDFERCRKTEKPQNVTQFCQFVTSRSLAPLLEEKGLESHREAILKLAKEYKKDYEQATFEKLVSLIR